MNEYSEQRFQNQEDLSHRIHKVYNEVPRIKEINNTISSISMDCARKILKGGSDNKALKEALASDIQRLSLEKTRLLKEHGYDDSYLELHYRCNLCKDTGYVENERCQCFNNRIIKALYQQSNIEEILKRENFDTFSTKYYDKEFVDPLLGCTPYENIQSVLNECKKFVDNFDIEYKNLYIYGEAGVGKTFLSNCIADKLISSGHSVIYLSSIKLFDMLSAEKFHKSAEDTADDLGLSSYLYDCDLLIIDDLGTELVNSFTTSELFNCINERNILRKSTIISSNLSLGQIKDIYAERIFSRLTTFTMLKVIGDDIRLKISLKSTD